MAELLPDPDPPGLTSPASPAAESSQGWPAFFLLHSIQAAVFIAALGWTGPDPISIALASAMVAWVHCLVFLRCNPRIAGLELIALLLGAYYTPSQSLYVVLWVSAGALAGGAAAWLAMRGSREEDFYFLPPAAALVSYALLVWLAEGCRFAEPLAAAAGWIRTEHALLADALRQSPNWTEIQSQLSDSQIDRLPGITLLMCGAIWALGLWLGGRSARRWSGAFDPRRASLILFRIEQHYLFLLICALVLWILGILAGREKLALCAAGPVLAVFAVACAIEGLAVVLFRLALWRTGVASETRRLLAVAMAVAFFFFWFVVLPACALLGLSDIWFDYRRIRAVEERLGSAP